MSAINKMIDNTKCQQLANVQSSSSKEPRSGRTYLKRCSKKRIYYLYEHNKPVPQFRKTVSKKQAHRYEEAEPVYNSDDLLSKTDIYTKVKKTDKTPTNSIELIPSLKKQERPNRIFIFRHAERMDATFGQNWINFSFDKEGCYEPKNLNMPPKLPKREGGPEKFNNDSPITMIGRFQSKLTGEGMQKEGVKISHAFSSPSLRCLETAKYVLEGLGAMRSVSIKVEPGLFEWMAWAKGNVPEWISPSDMADYGLEVDQSYKCLKHPEHLLLQETAEDYYRRSYYVIRNIVESIPSNSGLDILVLAHAGSLDALTRMLIGQLPRSPQELTKFTQQVPYVGCCMLEEVEINGWQLAPLPFPTLVHGPNKRFDWRDMSL